MTRRVWALIAFLLTMLLLATGAGWIGAGGVLRLAMRAGIGEGQ